MTQITRPELIQKVKYLEDRLLDLDGRIVGLEEVNTALRKELEKLDERVDTQSKLITLKQKRITALYIDNLEMSKELEIQNEECDCEIIDLCPAGYTGTRTIYRVRTDYSKRDCISEIGDRTETEEVGFASRGT